MKIAVLPADRAGCGYVRLIVPFRALRDNAARNGFEVVFGDRLLGAQGIATLKERGMDASADGFPLGTVFAMTADGPQVVERPDAVVFQRQTGPEVFNTMLSLQAAGTKIVFEFDDNFHDIPSSNPNAKNIGTGKPQTKMMERFVRAADLVVVSTQSLREYYTSFRDGKPTVVCENAVDDAQFARFGRELTGAPKREGQIRIGWAGSVTHHADFQPLVKPLCKLMDENPEVRIVFIGADMRQLFPAPYFTSVHMPWRNRVEFAGQASEQGSFVATDAERSDLAPIRYFDLINDSDFDIAVAPILPMAFNRDKSWIKVLEYGMLGIPTVASNFGPYRDYASRAVEASPIITALDPREWFAHLKMLVQNADARAAYAQRNRANVGRQHLISQNLAAWENALGALRSPVTV